MKITEKKEYYGTLIEEKKKEIIGNAIASGVCALGIVALEVLKNSGREFSDGFLGCVNWAMEPGLAVGTIACGFEMAKSIAAKSNLTKLKENAEKIIEIENARGAR